MAAEVGSKAPDFTLPNQDKQLVSLGASAGKTVVLAFFPRPSHPSARKSFATSATSSAR